LETAKEYVKKNEYFWNSGIFVWSVKTIVDALRMYQPSIADIFESIQPYYGTDKEQEVINEKFPQCDNISIDYAVMEKAEEIFVMPADFGWSDVGTWGSLLTLAEKDADGNAVIGSNVKLFESKNNIIHTSEERKVVVQGLDGYIVAEKDNTLLICKLDEEQRIKIFSE
jgi:mannose-1-phosphate guanylyltransferase